jgi:hypothetical protein
MLYVIAEQLGFPGLLNLIRYISFRAGAATATALLIGLLIGPAFINWLRAKQGKGQPIRADGPQSHLAKRGTPTMGGLMILISVGISVLLWMDLLNPYVWACLLVTAGFGLIGFLDDYDKVKKAHHAGLSGKTRLVLEVSSRPEFVDATLVQVQCHEIFASAPFYPIASYFRARVGLTAEDDESVRLILSDIGLDSAQPHSDRTSLAQGKSNRPQSVGASFVGNMPRGCYALDDVVDEAAPFRCVCDVDFIVVTILLDP